MLGRRETSRRARTPGAAAPGPTRTENVTLDHVGGLTTIVGQFREIAVSFRHPDIMARWGARRPQGILLYGPPGTGKTMLARALANEIGATFREIRTPEILDKWLGGSERNIKTIFQEARRYRHPTVMLFDEFDSIISYAGTGGDAASQAVNAVAGIFKQEMNNLIEDNPNVIVVATTNFPHRVDDSLIRSGRFDVKLSIPLPDEAGRAEIFKMKIRDLTERHEYAGFTMFADDVDPAALAAASHGFSGADVGEVLRRAQLAKAMQEARGGKGEPITQAELMRITTALCATDGHPARPDRDHGRAGWPAREHHPPGALRGVPMAGLIRVAPPLRHRGTSGEPRRADRGAGPEDHQPRTTHGRSPRRLLDPPRATTHGREPATAPPRCAGTRPVTDRPQPSAAAPGRPDLGHHRHGPIAAVALGA